jgi:transposase
LPGRDGAALKRWLRDHPGVEVVSRDRASAYAQAAEAAPKAKQVADRWHLLENVREMLERFFERHRGKVQAISSLLAQPLVSTENTTDQARQETASEQQAEAAQPAPILEGTAAEPMASEQARQAKRQRRVELYEEVRQRHSQGQSIRQIAKETGLSRNAVRRCLRSDQCPDWRPGQARRSRLDGFCAWIDEQINAGRDNAAELHRELTARGYQGSADSVRRFVTKRLAALGKQRQRANAAQPRSPPAPSARELSFDVIRDQRKREAEDQARVDALRAIDEEFAQVVALAAEFIALVRKEKVTPLADWLAGAEASASAESRSFAQGIRQDEAAVSAAISEPWSNGPVEGQVNRLKVIKRQMYGRASFALLRLRVLNAS